MKKDVVSKKLSMRFAALFLAGAMLFSYGAVGIANAAGDNAGDSSGPGDSVRGGGAAVTNQTDELGYSVKLYDNTNGLPTSDANAILSTNDGFLWIGGYSGLIRYDGTTFERITGIEGVTNVNTLFQDSEDRIWIGTNDNGAVVTYKSETLHFDFNNGLNSSSIRSIAEDSDGNIIIGTTQGLYYIDKSMKVHTLDEPLLNNDYIQKLVSDEHGKIYGSARSGSVFCIEGLKVTSTIKPSDIGLSRVNTVYPDPDEQGVLYLGTTDCKVYRGSISDEFKNVKTINIFDADVDGSVSNLSEADEKPVNWITKASGKIWVVRDDIVGWLDDSYAFHSIKNLPLNSAISSMEEDYEGNLWFSSTRQGILKIVENKFSNITERNGLKEAVVNATCLHEGNLYIGTDTGLQIFDNRSSLIKNPLVKHIGGARIRCIKEDKNQNLWISTYTEDLGLICYTKNKNIISFTTKNGMPDNQIRGTCETADGSILAATNKGIVVIKNNKVENVIDASKGLDNTVILTVEEDDDGTYYLGTDGGGIYTVNGSTITHKGRADGLTSDVILRIKKDKKRGVLWIITSNSIQYVKDGQIKEVKGFPYNNNYDIYFDKGDNAWVVASNGFYVVKAEDMLYKSEYDYQQYDNNSGLPSMATVNAYSELGDDGTLYVAARNGVFSVNIEKYFEKLHDIRLNVPYVEADGERYFADENNLITLPASAEIVTVYGFAITYSMQNPKIRYRLDGVDSDYNNAFKTEFQPVRYTNIKGGTYTFQLSVTNASTGQIQQTQKVTIQKNNAFYEETWFMLLVCLLALGLIFLVFRVYIARKTKAFLKKQEKDRLLIREMVEAFSKTIDMKDRYTRGHSARVARYTVMLAEEMGKGQEELDAFYNIALLHDIGKIGIPGEVLNKQGKLTDEEFAIIKSHTTLGRDALKNISIMPELAIGAGSHHERPDGHGYPEGLSGDDIPEVARIIAVADTFDAMYSDRPYRKRMNFDKAVSIIKEVSGTQLDSEVVDAFLRLVNKGYFKAKDDVGGGSTEDINNIRKNYDK